jgi:hypothetical protein
LETAFTEDGKYKRDRRNSGALVSTDIEGLKAYKLRKAKFNEINNRIERIESTLDKLVKLLTDREINR